MDRNVLLKLYEFNDYLKDEKNMSDLKENSLNEIYKGILYYPTMDEDIDEISNILTSDKLPNGEVSNYKKFLSEINTEGLFISYINTFSTKLSYHQFYNKFSKYYTYINILIKYMTVGKYSHGIEVLKDKVLYNLTFGDKGYDYFEKLFLDIFGEESYSEKFLFKFIKNRLIDRYSYSNNLYSYIERYVNDNIRKFIIKNSNKFTNKVDIDFIKNILANGNDSASDINIVILTLDKLMILWRDPINDIICDEVFSSNIKKVKDFILWKGNDNVERYKSKILSIHFKKEKNLLKIKNIVNELDETTIKYMLQDNEDFNKFIKKILMYKLLKTGF